MNSIQHLRLADGRKLAYAEYGPAEGQPVMAFHGAPGSRLELAGNLDTLRELNTRLIIVDRPGYGLSDFQENRRLLDWPADITQLADSLHLDRFAVIGFSAGGTYAAACAFMIPERLTDVTLISSPAPFDAPELNDEMMPASRALIELAADDYRQAEQQLAAVAGTPDALLNLFEAPLPAPDKTIFSDENFHRMYKANLAEALRQGLTGFAYDMSLIAKPWGFDPAAIKMDVCLWHGEDDINVPIGMGRYLANTIPHCQAHFLPGEGHLLMFTHWKKILQELSDEQ